MEQTVDKRQPHEMPFGEFAEAALASGAINRWPAIGSGLAVLSFSVYMNGEVGKRLTDNNKELEFQGVTVEALTERLGLDPESFRDNLRVAEIIATRNAWMGAVREANADRNGPGLSEEVTNDYTQLASNKTWVQHPWIQGELLKQQALSKQLAPVLKEAEQVLGMPVADRAPDEVSRGKIISQNAEFSTQSLDNGEVVTHENRRLETIPAKGKDVTVTYYRGSGQVQDNTQELTVSKPFIEDKSQDIAVALQDKGGETKQIVLFNGASTFAKFVEAHGLDPSMIEAAIEARVAKPKQIVQQETPERKAITGVYIDPETRGLAFDYMEKGQRNTMIFGSAQAIKDHALTFGITAAGIEQAFALETSQKAVREQANIEHTEVRTIGPGKLVNEARLAAAKAFPGNYERQAEFMQKVGERVEAQAQVKTEEKDKTNGKTGPER